MEEIIFLGLTLFIELPIVVAIAPANIRLRASQVAIFSNILTHPLAWLLSSLSVSWLAVESNVICCEVILMMLFFPIEWRRLGFAVFIANVISALFGYFFF